MRLHLLAEKLLKNEEISEIFLISRRMDQKTQFVSDFIRDFTGKRIHLIIAGRRERLGKITKEHPEFILDVNGFYINNIEIC